MWKKVNQPFKAMCERMNEKEKIEKVSKLFDELESMIRIRNKEISIKPTYDPSEEYSFSVYLSLIDEIKKILEE